MVQDEGRVKPKRTLTLRRRAYKNLYRNSRRRATHANSAEQKEGDQANDELPAGFSAESAADISPTTLHFPPGAFENQFDRGDGQGGELEAETYGGPEEPTDVDDHVVDARSIYSGYLPVALLRKPTPSVIGELPALARLVKEKLPSLSSHLKKKSGVYYKEKIPVKKLTVNLPPLATRQPDFLTRFKRGRIPLKPGFYQAPPTYPQHRIEKKAVERHRLRRTQESQEYREEVERRRIERERRHREQNGNGPDQREVERRRAERERRHQADKLKRPSLPPEIIAAPKDLTKNTTPEEEAPTFKIPRPPLEYQEKEDDTVSLLDDDEERLYMAD